MYRSRLFRANAHVNQWFRHPGYVPGIAHSAIGNLLLEAHLLVEGQEMHAWKDTRQFTHAKWFLNTVSAAEDPRKKDDQTFQSGLQFSQNISLLNQEIQKDCVCVCITPTNNFKILFSSWSELCWWWYNRKHFPLMVSSATGNKCLNSIDVIFIYTMNLL